MSPSCSSPVGASPLGATTNPFNTTAPSYLGVNFGSSKPVSRIRLYKDNDGGGASSDNFKNLVIEYTTSATSVPLAQRSWTRVKNLRNGYQGAEPLNATGVRIGFSNVTNPAFYNHYKVYEIEAWGVGQN